MKFEDALQAMREGKCVRLGKCSCGYVLDEYPNYKALINNEGNTMKFSSCDLLSEDWEIVK